MTKVHFERYFFVKNVFFLSLKVSRVVQNAVFNDNTPLKSELCHKPNGLLVKYIYQMLLESVHISSAEILCDVSQLNQIQTHILQKK